MFAAATLTPLALFGPLSGLEMVVIVMAALMVFGSRLPEVVLRGVAHIMRARRAVSNMWRETGLEEELRRVRRDIELSIPREADFDVKPPRAPEPIAAAPDDVDPGYDSDPDAYRADEEIRLEPAEGAVAQGDDDADDDIESRGIDGEDAAVEAESTAEATEPAAAEAADAETKDDGDARREPA